MIRFKSYYKLSHKREDSKDVCLRNTRRDPLKIIFHKMRLAQRCGI